MLIMAVLELMKIRKITCTTIGEWLKSLMVCPNNRILCNHYNFNDMKNAQMKKSDSKLDAHYNPYFMFINRRIYTVIARWQWLLSGERDYM